MSESQEKFFTKKPAKKKQEQHLMLYGFRRVLEMLMRDPGKVDLVFIRKGFCNSDSKNILNICRKEKVRFCLAEDATLDRLCRTNRNIHIAARIFPIGFKPYEEIIEHAASSPLPLILALDQVKDVGNAGSLARVMYALGGAGLVIPQHNGVYLGDGARNAASGALDLLPVSRVVNLSRALTAAKKHGLRVYGADMAGSDTPAADEREISIFEARLKLPAILVLGSEERGLRPQIKKNCDNILYIPMLREFNSLNVAQAGGIIISFFARQIIRQKKESL